MATEPTTLSQKWGRLRTTVRSAGAAISSEPTYLASLQPIAEDAVKLLSGKPSSETLEEVEYLLRRMETFIAKWRPSPEPTPGSFYIQPQWAESTDREAQEALRLVQEIRSTGFDTPDDQPLEGTMKVFVSHSSADKRIAEAFVDLLRAALPLSAKDIRCTSVDGYKLPAGINSDEQLRQEVFEAQTFLALLSPTSIQSIYVMFELGARWGAKRYLAPVMVAGLTSSALKAPLSAIHAVTGTSDGDLHQLIDTLSERLDVKPEKPAAYAKALKSFVTASKAPFVKSQIDDPEQPFKNPPPTLTAEQDRRERDTASSNRLAVLHKYAAQPDTLKIIDTNGKEYYGGHAGNISWKEVAANICKERGLAHLRYSDLGTQYHLMDVATGKTIDIPTDTKLDDTVTKTGVHNGQILLIVENR